MRLYHFSIHIIATLISLKIISSSKDNFDRQIDYIYERSLNSIENDISFMCPGLRRPTDCSKLYLWNDESDSWTLVDGKEGRADYEINLRNFLTADKIILICQVKSNTSLTTTKFELFHRKYAKFVPHVMVYNSSEVQFQTVNLGEDIVLKCPVKNHDEAIVWRKPVQFKIVSRKKIRVGQLILKSVKVKDLGTYYCGYYEVDSNGYVYIKAKAIVLDTKKPEKNILQTDLMVPTMSSRIQHFQHILSYYCSMKSTNPNSFVEWEGSNGRIVISAFNVLNVLKGSLNEDYSLPLDDMYFCRVNQKSSSNNKRVKRKAMLQEETNMNIGGGTGEETAPPDKLKETDFISLGGGDEHEEEKISVSVNPREVRIPEGINDFQIKCNITVTGGTMNPTLFKWEFIPMSDGGVPTGLPAGVTKEFDDATQSSLLKFSETKVVLSGVYQCSYKDTNKDRAKVYIYGISVFPEESRVRLGMNARFLCKAEDSFGATKVYFTRKDKREFISREQQRGDNGKAVLVVSQIEWNDHNTEYICNYRDLNKTAKLLVNEPCSNGQKQCKNGQCLAENLFCDGKGDCDDKSDEIKEICDRCEPNELSCKVMNETEPTLKCYLKHWHCDGDQDCGNGWDERNCADKVKNKCQGSHYMCNDNATMIPRAYWCDQEKDCFSGDDEEGCRDPIYTYPTEETGRVLSVQTNKTIVLMCKVTSRPLATIIWRYNWGHMPEDQNYTVEQTFDGCDRTVSKLTIHNAREIDSGIYTCEANSKKRAMGEDYHVLVTNSGNVCKKPYFNDAAFFKEECLECFCFNRTDECLSLQAYAISSVPKTSSVMESDFDVIDYRLKKILEKSRNSNFWSPTTSRYIINSELYNDIKSPDLFLRGSFGMSGSWLMSYGRNLRYTLTLRGKSVGVFQGPLLVLYGDSLSINWCRPPNRMAIYAEEQYLDNMMEVKLLESDNWYTKNDCTEKVSRAQMMRVLSNVNQIAVRIKYYREQTNFEMSKLTLEYAEPSSWNSNFLPFVESCKCPKGYQGHSCEKCSFNYRATKDNRCEPICNCPKCDENGDCIECKGNNADGPRCRQCKPGFYRDPNLPLSADCVSCNCPENAGSLDGKISKECVADSRSTKGYQCRCKSGPAQPQTCLVECLDGSNTEGCEKKKLTECSETGTDSVSGSTCTCKAGYRGTTCEECEAGYFKLDNRCRKCYCSGNTTDCTLAPNHHFVTAAQKSEENAYGYELSYSLGRRYLDGVHKIQNENQYLKISENLLTLQSSKLPGAVFLMIDIKSNKKYRNGIYGLLYGGKMSFNLEPMVLNSDIARNPEITPVVEIMTPKFSRIWTKPYFDKSTKQYQLEFDENFWFGWSDQSNQPIGREKLLRALLTARSIALVISSKPDALENMRLTDLKIEVAEAREMGQSPPGESRAAPVEKCNCGLKSGALGLSCEGCRDPNYQSQVSVQPDRDFKCGGCIKDCQVCNKGSYKYDFLLDQTFATCQPGLTIDPPARVIDLNVGERLEIPCRVKSFRGGAPIHRWVKVNLDGSTSSVKLVYERDYVGDDVSEAKLIVENIQKSDEGIYRCEAWNLVSDINADYYVKVNDRDPRFSIKINVESIKPDRPKEIDINGDIKVKGPSKDYQFIWTNLNGTKVKTNFNVKPDSSGGPIKMTITMGDEKDNNIRFQIVGSNPSKPYYFIYEKDKIPRESKGDPDYSGLYVDKQDLTINFLDGGRFRLMNPKDLPIKVRWFKEGYNDTDGRSYPIGMSQRGNDLVIYSGGNNHNGNYIVEIRNPKTDKVVKTIKVRLNVGNMLEQKQTNINNKTKQLEEYFPSEKYCPNHKWTLTNRKTGEKTDITDKIVAQGNDSRVFLINAKIMSDSTIEFTCKAVPKANLTGKVEVGLNSREPRIKIKAIYGNDASPYPTRVTCIDENKDEPSEISWSTTAKDSLNSDKVQTDARPDSVAIVFKEFKPYLNEGKYTCTAKNRYSTKSETVEIPGFDKPPKEFETKIQIISKGKIVKDVKTHEGGRVELVCQTIGSPKPYKEIVWMFEPRNKPGILYPLSREDAPRQGVLIRNPDSCYSTLTITQFESSANEGNYYCRSDFKGTAIDGKVSIKVMEPIDVIVKGLYRKKLTGYENGEQFLFCTTTRVSETSLEYRWEFRSPDDKLVNKTILAGDLEQSGNILALSKLKALDDRKISGRCVVTKDGNEYYSEPFDVKIFLEHVYAPKLDVSVEYTKNKDGVNVPSKISCTDSNTKAKSNVTLTFEGSSSLPPKAVVADSSQTASITFDDFSVTEQSGYYVCTAVNPYAEARKSVLLPSYKNPSDNQPPRVRIYTQPPLKERLEDGKRILVHQVGVKVKFLCEVYGQPQPTHISWNLRKPKPKSDTPEPRTELNLNNPQFAMGNGFEVTKLNPYLSEAHFAKDAEELGGHDIKCTASNPHGSDSAEVIIEDSGILLKASVSCKIPDEFEPGEFIEDCTMWRVNVTSEITCGGFYEKRDPAGNLVYRNKAESLKLEWIFSDKEGKVIKPEDDGIEMKENTPSDSPEPRIFQLKHTRRLPQYKTQCKLTYNDSYSAYSRNLEISFIDRGELPKIQIAELLIMIENEDPQVIDMSAPSTVHPISFDSSQSSNIICTSKGSGDSVSHVWYKCLAVGSNCIAAKKLIPETDTVILNSIKSHYTDGGIYGCKVTRRMGRDQEEHWLFANITINAKPNIRYMKSKVLFSPETVEVPCIEESASPASRISWSFRPYNTAADVPFQALPQGTETRIAIQNRKVILKIFKEKLSSRFNGEYKCTATNSFGSVERTFFLSLRKPEEDSTLPQIGDKFELVLPGSSRILRAVQGGGDSETVLRSLIRVKTNLWIYKIDPSQKFEVNIKTSGISSVANLEYTWFKCLTTDCVSKIPLSTENGILRIHPSSISVKDSGVYEFLIRLKLDGQLIDEKLGRIHLYLKDAKPKISVSQDRSVMKGKDFSGRCEDIGGVPASMLEWNLVGLSDTDLQPLPVRASVFKLGKRTLILRMSKDFTESDVGTFACTGKNRKGSDMAKWKVQIQAGQPFASPQLQGFSSVVAMVIKKSEPDDGQSLKSPYTYTLDTSRKAVFECEITKGGQPANDDWNIQWLKCLDERRCTQNEVSSESRILTLSANSVMQGVTISQDYKCVANLKNGPLKRSMKLYLKKKMTEDDLVRKISIFKVKPVNNFHLTSPFAYAYDVTKGAEFECRGPSGDDIIYKWLKCKDTRCKKQNQISENALLKLGGLDSDGSLSVTTQYQCVVEKLGSDHWVKKVNLHLTAYPRMNSVRMSIIKLRPIDGIDMEAPYIYFNAIESDEFQFQCLNKAGQTDGVQWSKCEDNIASKCSELNPASPQLLVDKVKIPAEQDTMRQWFACIDSEGVKTRLEIFRKRNPVARVFQIKPITNKYFAEPYNYTVDPSETAVFECLSPMQNKKIIYHWIKCMDEDCLEEHEISPDNVLEVTHSKIFGPNEERTKVELRCTLEIPGEEEIKHVSMKLTRVGVFTFRKRF